MELAKAAEWIRKENIQEEFIKHFGGEIMFREQGFKIIVEYIPVTFQTEARLVLRATERENQLEKEKIVNARYLKDIYK